MARTTVGRLVTAAGWFSLLLAVLLTSLAPAFVGVALLAYAAAAHRALSGAEVRVQRLAPDRTESGAAFEVTTEATVEPALPVSLTDRHPAGAAILERRGRPGRGRATDQALLRADEAGRLEWMHATARIADPWGLHEDAVDVSLATTVRVAPEAKWVAAGRHVGRRHTVNTIVKRRHSFETLADVSHVRPYQPGDRVRDIDWARSSRLQELFTRERERGAPRPVMILLDATVTMRWKRRVSKLQTASRFAYGLTAAAEGAGVTANVIVFDEHGVHHAGTSTRGRRGVSDALERLVDLRPAIPLKRVPVVPVAGKGLTEEDKAFLSSVAPFVKGPAPASPPLDAALSLVAKRVTHTALVVAILDAEAHPRAAEVAVSRLAKAGHQTVLAVPATGAHHYARGDVDTDILADLVEARERRETVRRALQPYRVPMTVLRPGREIESLEEVADWAT